MLKASVKQSFLAYISGTVWATKIYLHFFASVFEELSARIVIFQIRAQNQLICAIRCFLKKISHWKKSAILKNSKIFLDGLKVWKLYISTFHLNFNVKNAHATFSDWPRFVYTDAEAMVFSEIFSNG